MFRKLASRLMEARQDRANEEVARLLQIEYPNESVEYIIANVVEKAK